MHYLLVDQFQVDIAIYEGKLDQSRDRILSSHITNIIIILVNTNIPDNIIQSPPIRKNG